MTESFEEDKEDPWAGISATDIQMSIDRTVDQTPTFRAVLFDVLDGEECRAKAEESLNYDSADEIFSRFLEDIPIWVVMCEVTDSMVSGQWGLKAFTIGRRGYLYCQPDEDEPYIVGAWEPAEDKRAFRVCLLNAYTSNWEQCILPPAMGQWASGPFDAMLDAICTVLQEDPESWRTVLQELRNHNGRGAGLDELVEITSESVGMQSRVVGPILRSYSDSSGAATVVHPKSLPEQGSRAHVAAFLHVIDSSR